MPGIKRYLQSRRILLTGIVVTVLVVVGIVLLDGSILMYASTTLYIPLTALFIVFCSIVADYACWRAKWRSFAKFEAVLIHGGASRPEPAEHKLSGDHAVSMDAIVRVADVLEGKIAQTDSCRSDDIDFFSTWIHELKTPVSVMGLVLQNHSMDGDDRTALRLRRELTRLETNLEKALYYLRSSTFERDYRITTVEIEPIVRERVRMLEDSWKSRDIDLRLEGPWFNVATDAKWISFIIGQLLENAARYTATEGSVVVSMARSADGSSLTVTDSGPGISLEDAPRIFDRGYTGESGRENLKSSGLGLYLAATLCTRLGHRISLLPGHETSPAFRISFPKWSDHIINSHISSTG